MGYALGYKVGIPLYHLNSTDSLTMGSPAHLQIKGREQTLTYQSGFALVPGTVVRDGDPSILLFWPFIPRHIFEENSEANSQLAFQVLAFLAAFQDVLTKFSVRESLQHRKQTKRANKYNGISLI